MSQVITLNLPNPSPALLEELHITARTMEPDPGAGRWLNDFYSGEINSVDQLFPFVDSDLNSKLQSEYSMWFKHPVTFVLGVMRSPDSNPACLPPHIDRGRALAINYYFDLGGDQVTTVFYDYEDVTQTDTAKNLLYQDLNVVETQVFKTNTWYAYDVNRAHSVEDIVSSRYFFSIVIASDTANYKLRDFISDYPNLIIER